MENAFTLIARMYGRKSLLVAVPFFFCLSKKMSFRLVSFVRWDRRTKSGEEQQALFSFWS